MISSKEIYVLKKVTLWNLECLYLKQMPTLFFKEYLEQSVRQMDTGKSIVQRATSDECISHRSSLMKPKSHESTLLM